MLLRSNGTPMFLLANVVDDADMGITHVIRGEDHVNGTPKYLLLVERARPRRPAGVRPPAAPRQRAAQEAVEATRRRGACPTTATGATCPRRWSTTWRCSAGGRPTASRSGRSSEIVEPVPARGRQPVAGVLRHQEARPHQRRVHPGARPCPSSSSGRAVPAAAASSRPSPPSPRSRPRSSDRVRTFAEVRRHGRVPLAGGAEGRRSGVGQGDAVARRWPPTCSTSCRPASPTCRWTRGTSTPRSTRRPTRGRRPSRPRSIAAAEQAGIVNDEGKVQLSKAQAPVRVALTGRAVGPPLFELMVALGRDRTLDRLRQARSRLG